MAELRLYGVSSGDGNDGVSHIFADYYVRTDDPYRLATLALVGRYKPEWQARAKAEMTLDGEAEYTISACLYEPVDFEPENDGDSWCDANGCADIVEVFPEDKPREGRMIYDGLQEAFDAKLLSMIPAE